MFSNLLINPVPGGNSRQTWIDLCQKARADPRDLINGNLDKLFKLVLEASTVDAKVCQYFVCDFS